MPLAISSREPSVFRVEVLGDHLAMDLSNPREPRAAAPSLGGINSRKRISNISVIRFDEITRRGIRATYKYRL